MKMKNERAARAKGFILVTKDYNLNKAILQFQIPANPFGLDNKSFTCLYFNVFQFKVNKYTHYWNNDKPYEWGFETLLEKNCFKNKYFSV